MLGAVGSYFAAPFAYDNREAVGIFVTVYSVFAGFLVAVIAILGDPALLPSGSWQKAENHREAIENRLIRHMAVWIIPCNYRGHFCERAFARCAGRGRSRVGQTVDDPRLYRAWSGRVPVVIGFAEDVNGRAEGASRCRD